MLFTMALGVFSQNPNNDPAAASKNLITPENHMLLLIDHEGQMAFGTHSIDIQTLRNNTGIVAGASKLFGVNTLVTTVAEKSFSGPVFPEIKEYYPEESKYIDRTTMNAWEDKRVPEAVQQSGKKKLVLAGLWTEVCIVCPALSAIEAGYDVYVITDASGGVTKEAHEMAVLRMIQAGAIPMTSVQYLLELQRDWARSETYSQVNALIKKYAGSYGLGVDYITTMKEWIN